MEIGLDQHLLSDPVQQRQHDAVRIRHLVLPEDDPEPATVGGESIQLSRDVQGYDVGNRR
ncbi:MAG: hypothetical protein MAG451_01166 [Anaerolineales bacterium]|nr:hypothetical protein [Anaerolineales bacterium]